MTSLRLLSKLFLALSLIGFTDAAYLTIAHYTDAPVPCSLVGECEKVLMSSYAVVGAVPLALIGAVYYIAVFVIALVALAEEKYRLLFFAATLGLFGFIVSLGLLFVQIFVIKALCFYCLISGGISLLLALLGTRYLFPQLLVAKKREWV